MPLRRCLSVAVIAAGILTVSAPLAGATTLTVTTTNDSGPGSLRATVAGANANDTISIPAGRYVLASQIVISKPLQLSGNTPRTTIVDGGGATRIFEISPQAGSVTIDHLTLAHGAAPSGGAIDAHAKLALVWDAILDNTATTGSGGGIYASEPTTILQVLVKGNSAPNGNGGGMELAPTKADVDTILDSTFTANSARFHGGGLDQPTANGETLVLTGNTFDGNTLAPVNVWPGPTGGNLFTTGGPSNGQHDSNLLMYGNAFTHGVAADHADCQITGSLDAGSGYNAEDGDGGCIVHANPGDRWIADPEFGPLADNGGLTDTLMPAAGSPLVDVVPLGVNCSDTSDQRGLARPRGPLCDIGAVER
jgi:predicted outer membrane repeat protein